MNKNWREGHTRILPNRAQLGLSLALTDYTVYTSVAQWSSG